MKSWRIYERSPFTNVWVILFFVFFWCPPVAGLCFALAMLSLGPEMRRRDGLPGPPRRAGRNPRGR
jgi:hypothetical protein